MCIYIYIYIYIYSFIIIPFIDLYIYIYIYIQVAKQVRYAGRDGFSPKDPSAQETLTYSNITHLKITNLKKR